jgi:dTDP-4-dehydrorhamnose 3,5-epimerase
VAVIVAQRYHDDRGWFAETFNAEWFAAATGFTGSFVQENQSRSIASVIRGLHYQVGENAQGKLVRVVAGAVFDVAVDLRKDGADFGRWTGHTLTAEGGEQMWIPAGHAHGFAVLSDGAEIVYKVTAPYHPESERSVRWDDPDIGIAWPITDPLLSDRDRAAPPLAEAATF